MKALLIGLMDCAAAVALAALCLWFVSSLLP